MKVKMVKYRTVHWPIIFTLTGALSIAAFGQNDTGASELDKFQRNVVSYSSKDNPIEIPFGTKLEYAFLILGNLGDEIAPKDQKIFKNAKNEGPIEIKGRSQTLIQEACGLNASRGLDARAIANTLAESVALEKTDKETFYESQMMNLSPKTQAKLQKIMEDIDGTDAISVSEIDYESLADELPTLVVELFDRFCRKPLTNPADKVEAPLIAK